MDCAGACEGLCWHPGGREMELGELWGGCAARFVVLGQSERFQVGSLSVAVGATEIARAPLRV